MPTNPWDQIGDSLDSGINTGLNIQKMRLEKQRMAQEAIKQKFEMHQKNYEHAWQVVKDPDIPGSVKVNYWNHIIVPFDTQIMGTKTPEMTQWNDDLQRTMTRMANLVQKQKNGEISLSDLKMARVALGAEVASNPKQAEAFKPVDSLIAEMSGGTPTTVDIGGKKVTVSKNVEGSYDPLQVNGVGKAVAPSDLSVTQDKNKLDAFNTAKESMLKAATIIGAEKDGTLTTLLKRWGWDTSSDGQQQAINTAHANMYLNGGQMGIANKDIRGMIDGSLDSMKILSEVGKKFALPGVSTADPKTPKVQVNPSFLKDQNHPLAAPDPTLSEAPAEADAPQMANASGGTPPAMDAEKTAALPDDQKDMANV